MGMRSGWQCSNQNCKHSLGPVSGRRDRGMKAVTLTRICESKKCQHVADYFIGTWGGMKDKITDPNPKCKKCRGATIDWKHECPKCGEKMEQSFFGEMQMWD